MRILIAEDDKFLAKAYQVKFEKLEHEVRIASDGEEVFTLLEGYDPDVILLDLVMPKMDGFAVLEKLKANETTKSIPVVVASNLGQEEDVEKCKKLGAEKFVVKSNLSIQELIEQTMAVVQ